MPKYRVAMPDEVRRRLTWNGWRYELTTLGVGICGGFALAVVLDALGHPPNWPGYLIGLVVGAWIWGRG